MGRRYVWSKHPKTMNHVGPQRHRKEKVQYDLRESGRGPHKFSHSQMSTCKTTKTCPDLELNPV